MQQGFERFALEFILRCLILIDKVVVKIVPPSPIPSARPRSKELSPLDRGTKTSCLQVQVLSQKSRH